MTQKKITKRDYFNGFLAKYPLTDEEVKFVEHELELLDRKSAGGGEKKLTATQIENEGYKANILDFMTEGTLYSITDLIKSIPELNEFTNQKVNALVKQMYADVKKGQNTNDFPLVRSEVKGRAYFSLNPDYVG